MRRQLCSSQQLSEPIPARPGDGSSERTAGACQPRRRGAQWLLLCSLPLSPSAGRGPVRLSPQKAASLVSAHLVSSPPPALSTCPAQQCSCPCPLCRGCPRPLCRLRHSQPPAAGQNHPTQGLFHTHVWNILCRLLNTVLKVESGGCVVLSRISTECLSFSDHGRVRGPQLGARAVCKHCAFAVPLSPSATLAQCRVSAQALQG